MKTLIMVTLIAGCNVIAQSQSANKSYWVVEGNVNKPFYTIIRYYDGNNTLIKEERLRGKFLNIRKRRNREFLDRKLVMVNRTLNNNIVTNRKK